MIVSADAFLVRSSQAPGEQNPRFYANPLYRPSARIAALYSQDATPDMDRQRFTREVLTGYSNIAKTSLVSFQQG
ncbi:hypothetical protein GFL95_36740 [Rhizobium leguminosarum bv. viciae]|nr:hypothetical protein [Rhizobium leguminosarum bv. viciae]